MLFSTIWKSDPVNAGYLSVPLRNLAGPEICLSFLCSNSVFIFEFIIIILILLINKVSN